MTKIINLTPHEINIGDKTIPSSGVVRVSEQIEVYFHLGDIPVIKKTFGEVENLLPQEEDTYYVVSLIVAQAISKKNQEIKTMDATLYELQQKGLREDILTIGETIRDDKGQVVGARSLAVV